MAQNNNKDPSSRSTIHLTRKRLLAPPDVRAGHVEEVDVDAPGIDAVRLEQVGDVGRDGPVGLHGDGPDRVHAAEGGGRVAAGKDHVGLVGDGDGCLRLIIV